MCQQYHCHRFELTYYAVSGLPQRKGTHALYSKEAKMTKTFLGEKWNLAHVLYFQLEIS